MNEQNLTPFTQEDGRTADRKKGGLISGYKRLQRNAQVDFFYSVMLETEISIFMRQNQNKPWGKKRNAKAKELLHQRKILDNRLKRHAAKLEKRRAELLSQGIEI